MTAGGNGVSFAVENCGAGDLAFTMDCGAAKNAVSHRGGLAYTATAPPGKIALLHHLSPRGPGMWSWSYECEWDRADPSAPKRDPASPFHPQIAPPAV